MNINPDEWMTGTARTGTPAGDTMKEIAQHHEHVLNLARRMYEQGWNDAQNTFDNPLQFDHVYYGVKGTHGKHLHAVGMCDHSKGLRPATSEQADLPYCGQCVNKVRSLKENSN